MNSPTPESSQPPGQPQQPDDGAPSLSEVLAAEGRRYSPANRRTTSWPIQHLQSLALVASTLVAAVFCILYINKPVVITTPDRVTRTTPNGVIRAPAVQNDTSTNQADAPDEETPVSVENPVPGSGTRDGHEETNLRVQHVLNAATPGGDLSRIVLDVPVLYPSRNLRWTDAEVTQARGILARVADYHEQSRSLRDLGAGILSDWNALIERSIPVAELRADSPSLPANQEGSSHLPRPAILDTTDSIEVQPSTDP